KLCAAAGIGAYADLRIEAGVLRDGEEIFREEVDAETLTTPLAEHGLRQIVADLDSAQLEVVAILQIQRGHFRIVGIRVAVDDAGEAGIGVGRCPGVLIFHEVVGRTDVEATEALEDLITTGAAAEGDEVELFPGQVDGEAKGDRWIGVAEICTVVAVDDIIVL